MSWFKEKLIFPLCSLLLVVSIFAPYAIKISHGIYEHKEFNCISHGELHIHEVEFDCDFQKFKLTTQFYPVFIDDLSVFSIALQGQDDERYIFLTKFQQFHFSLRGPPNIS
jgi:hypothetical protein